MPRSPAPILAAVLTLSVAASAGATDFFTDLTAVSSPQENSCLATTAAANGDDCSYNASNPSALGTSQWIGPTFSAGYYAPGAGPAVYSNPVVPNPVIAPAANPLLAGKTGIPVTAIIGISDGDTPLDPSDDRILVNFTFQAFERNVDLGDGTRALEKFDGIDQALVIQTVTTATANGAGGFDYVVGESVPDLLNGSTTANGGFADSFPSEVASQSSMGITDKPYWTAPGAKGIARFEGNPGGAANLNAAVRGYSCTTDTGSGPAPCVTTDFNWDTGARAAFQNMLIKVSTDATGRITSGLMILVKEFKLLPGSVGNDSWQALTVPITGGTVRPIAVTDSVPFNGMNPITIDVLANDLNLTDTPITVTVASNPASGTAVVNPDNTITYTPTATVIRDNFQYRITNASGRSSGNGAVLLGANDVPVTQDDLANLNGLSRATAFSDYTLSIPFKSNDTGLGDAPLTYKTVTPPAHGTAQYSPQSDSYIYTPTQGGGFFGTEHFQYKITDANKDSSTSTITVRGFLAVQDHPSAVSGLPINIPILQNDYGRSDSPVVVEITRAPTHGTMTLNADNTVTYTPDKDFTGRFIDGFFGTQCESAVSCGDIFQYTLRNAEGDTSIAAVFIDVYPPPNKKSGGSSIDPGVSLGLLALARLKRRRPAGSRP